MAEICFNCFRNKPDGGVCPFCGYDHTGSEEKFPLALKPGTVLANRYYLGRVLGQGGFGITYIALDGTTQSRVAIKEYLPRELAMRDQYTHSLQIYSANDRENFEYGKQQFLDEAKTLAQFYGNEHIISIQSYFEENGTAYFAMEYMEGVNLKQYMEQLGRPLEVYEANRILLPVMESLEWVHSKGIIHRDISPDNIMIRRDGTAKLIDFGSARYSTGEVSQSLDVILKHGFAPREQYTRRGRQGPFTDVYSMAATNYYAITGKVPPDAIDRTEKDELIRPSALGVKIRKSTEAALLKGLAVSASDRWQTMREFYSAMVQSMPNPFQPDEGKTSGKPVREKEKPQKKQSETPSAQTQKSQSTDAKSQNSHRGTTPAEERSHAESGRKPEETPSGKPRKKGGLIAAMLLVVVVIVAGIVFLKPGVLPSSNPEEAETTSTPEPTPEEVPETPVPTPTPTPAPTPPNAPKLSSTSVVSDFDIGDTLLFGQYEQDNDLSNGKEDIEWLVLAKEDNRLLVISKYALERQKYHEESANVTWETCSLRGWLNETFRHEAFSEEEQALIPTVTVSADRNPNYSTSPGHSTKDQIFLLSIPEADKYFSSSEARRCAPTLYAKTQGVSTRDSYYVDGRAACMWWLRTPGKSTSSASFVYNDGSISDRGTVVSNASYAASYGGGYAVRPAMWIELEIYAVGDTLSFGSYEQDNDTSNGKEEIEWQVLAKEDNRILVISRYGLDCQPYNTAYTEVTWETCTLRKWLNETFRHTAFSAEERAMIPIVTVSADTNPSWGTNPGNSTKDRIFLLSIPEADKYFSSDEARKCTPTDYAIAQGAYIDYSYKVDSKATCWWWLRSPGRDSSYAALVGIGGSVSSRGYYVINDSRAVRPALWINLES